MTALAFHFGAPDKVAYTCRLLRKAVGSGARVLVLSDPQTARQLDNALWSVSPIDFVAHCDAAASDRMQGRSPVLLLDGPDADISARAGAYTVMVNLTSEVPDGFASFDRVIEVVSLDDDDRQLARRRWRRYTELGFDIQKHDLQLRSPN